MNRWVNRRKVKLQEQPEWMQSMNSVEDLKQYKISCQWVDSWKGILENTSKSTNSKPFKYIKWAKQSSYKDIECLSSAQEYLGQNNNTIWERIGKLQVRNKVKGFLWDLHRSRLGIFIDASCTYCKEPSSGNHIIKCKWINTVLKCYVKEYDRLNRTNFWRKSINPFNLDYDNTLNTKLGIFIWALWKNYTKNIIYNTVDLWTELHCQHIREQKMNTTYQQQRIKVPTTTSIRARFKELKRKSGT